MITISKRIKAGLNQPNETITPNFISIENTQNLMLAKNLPIYVETTISDIDNAPKLQINVYETNFKQLSSHKPFNNFAFRTHFKENGLYGACITTKPIASLQGDFDKDTLNIKSLQVDNQYYHLSLGELLLGTAEDLCFANNYTNMAFNTQSLLKQTSLQEIPQTIFEKAKSFVLNKIEQLAIKADIKVLDQYLKDYGFEHSNGILVKNPQKQCVLQPSTALSAWNKLQPTLQVANETYNIATLLTNNNPSL